VKILRGYTLGQRRVSVVTYFILFIDEVATEWQRNLKIIFIEKSSEHVIVC
jgi:hypothetical protein